LAPPLDVLPPPEPLAPDPLPLDDEDDVEELASSDVPSMEASAGPRVAPPQAAPTTAIAQRAVKADGRRWRRRDQRRMTTLLRKV
jgi:hypothetical protein